MRFPRVLPPPPHVPWRPAAGTAWCTPCNAWRQFDVIPAVRSHDIPPFPICTHCGAGVDTHLEEAS